MKISYEHRDEKDSIWLEASPDLNTAANQRTDFLLARRVSHSRPANSSDRRKEGQANRAEKRGARRPREYPAKIQNNPRGRNDALHDQTLACLEVENVDDHVRPAVQQNKMAANHYVGAIRRWWRQAPFEFFGQGWRRFWRPGGSVPRCISCFSRPGGNSSLVGSRTGAVLRRFGLAVAPRFL